MASILLLGAGELGSRHLQGLAKIVGENSIFVIDPSKDSLEISEKRLNEMQNRNLNNKITYNSELFNIPDQIDLAIISTNADIRKKLLDDVVNIKDIKNIILEKFLFQKESEFYEIGELLKNKRINAWVNCARRMYPEFRAIKQKLLNKQIRDIRVSGSNWAMASNSIHMIDLFSYLTGSDEYIITDNFLFNHIYENKRPGFIEFNGKIKGRFINNTQFCISCYPGYKADIQIEILLEDSLYIIKQIEQKLIIQRKQNNNWFSEEVDFPVYFQSNLTHLVVEQILKEKKCDLPTYNESMKLHLPLLKVFTEQFKKMQKTEDIYKCPIT